MRSGLFTWMRENHIAPRPARQVEVGDIVCCCTQKNWVDPQTMGKVVAVHNKAIKLLPPKGKGIYYFIVLFWMTHTQVVT